MNFSKLNLNGNEYNVKDDKARNDIELINSNISEVRNDIESANSSIDENVNSIINLNNLTSIVQSEMVVIGDSYSSRSYLASGNKLWNEIVSEYEGLNLHNYSDPGAGFLADGDERQSTFSSQLDEAKNDSSFENNRVKYVFIYGGTNDIQYYPQSNNKDTYKNAFNDVFTKAREYFPNSKIYYLGCTTFGNLNSKTSSDGENITELWIDHTIKNLDIFKEKGIISIDLTLFFIGMSDYFTNSISSHPNGKAHKDFASAVINGINSSGYAFQHLVNSTPVINESSTEKWSNENTLTNKNLIQLRITDKSIKMFLATCLNRLDTGASNYEVKINLPFNLRIPYSNGDKSVFTPPILYGNCNAFQDTHDIAGMKEMGTSVWEIQFGYEYIKMYYMWINSSLNKYDVILNTEINI